MMLRKGYSVKPKNFGENESSKELLFQKKFSAANQPRPSPEKYLPVFLTHSLNSSRSMHANW